MASTNHTPHLELNQWIGTDPVLMADFNADNAKLDAAFAQLPHAVTGSYTGTGQYGSEHPNTLSFPFAPKLLVVLSESGNYFGPTGSDSIYNGWLMAVPGVTGAYLGSYNVNAAVRFDWSGNSVSWYTERPAPGAQCNAQNTVYHYFAIG